MYCVAMGTFKIVLYESGFLAEAGFEALAADLIQRMFRWRLPTPRNHDSSLLFTTWPKHIRPEVSWENERGLFLSIELNTRCPKEHLVSSASVIVSRTGPGRFNVITINGDTQKTTHLIRRAEYRAANEKIFQSLKSQTNLALRQDTLIG